jgi:hypothetical protein
MTRRLGRRQSASQLFLELDAPTPPRPRTANELLARLRLLGLSGIDRCRLTRNRTVMVSFRGRELRVHEGYLDATIDIHRSIAAFVSAKSAAGRRTARAKILSHPVVRPASSRRPERMRPEDQQLAIRLRDAHRRYNTRHFGGELGDVRIRVSRRMRARLGHYMSASAGGESAEIVISRRHIKRHGWEEALHTLLHEMVHQWQDEHGHAIDHGGTFRQKACEIGITPSACRAVGPAPSEHVSRQAAREG